MDLSHCHGRALLCARLPLALLRSPEAAEDTAQSAHPDQAPGSCPLKMSSAYRKQRTRFPYKRLPKNG